MIQIVQGIVLRAEDSGEFDQRLTLYTRELGKLRAKIVGVKKTISKLRCLAIPLTESRIQIYLHGTPRAGLNDPGKVVGGEALFYHAPLREDWDRMIHGVAFCEVVDTLTHTFYPQAQQYELLSATLKEMEVTSNPLLVRLRSILILLRVLGYSLRHHATWKLMGQQQKKTFYRPGHLGCSRESFFENGNPGSGTRGSWIPVSLFERSFENSIISAKAGQGREPELGLKANAMCGT